MDNKKLNELVKKAFKKHFGYCDTLSLVKICEKDTVVITYAFVDRISGIILEFSISGDEKVLIFRANSCDTLLSNPVLLRSWLDFMEDLEGNR